MSKIDDLQAAARKALNEGNVTAAVEHLEALHQETPADTDINLALILVYARAEKWGQAVSLAHRLIDSTSDEELKPGVSTLAVLIAALHADGQQSEYQEIYEHLSPRLISILKSSPRPHFRQLYEVGNGASLQVEDIATEQEIMPGRYWPGEPDWAAIPIIISKFSPLKEGSEAAGGGYHEFDTPQMIDMVNGTHEYNYVHEPFRVAIIPNGEVLYGSKFVRTSSGEMLDYSLRSSKQRAPTSRLILHRWPETATSIDEDVILFSGASMYNVGHWIIEYMSKLRAIPLSGIQGVKVCVPGKLSNKLADLLAHFNIGRDR